MTERPILFSAPMIRALLEGRKTHTRRVIFTANVSSPHASRDCFDANGYDSVSDTSIVRVPWTAKSIMAYLRCPYGAPGDRLWCRETFCLESSREVGWYEPPFSDGRPLKVHDDEDGRWWQQPHYKATDPAPELEIGTGEPGVIWKPSIHMPRWASRLTLEITDVQVQRVQEISEEDAIAEGIQIFGATPLEILSAMVSTMKPVTRRAFLASALAVALGVADVLAGRRALTNREAFAVLWDRINGRRGYGWDANPWTWVLTFRRLA